MLILHLHFSETLDTTILGIVMKEICRGMKIQYWNDCNRHGYLADPRAVEGISTLQAGEAV